jgi:hypothetical protein
MYWESASFCCISPLSSILIESKYVSSSTFCRVQVSQKVDTCPWFIFEQPDNTHFTASFYESLLICFIQIRWVLPPNAPSVSSISDFLANTCFFTWTNDMGRVLGSPFRQGYLELFCSTRRPIMFSTQVFLLWLYFLTRISRKQQFRFYSILKLRGTYNSCFRDFILTRNAQTMMQVLDSWTKVVPVGMICCGELQLPRLFDSAIQFNFLPDC